MFLQSTSLLHPLLGKTKRQLHGACTRKSDEDEFNEDYDVNTSMDVEASTNDSEAILDTLVVDFVTGDIIGEVLAFVNQIYLCGEDTQKYLSALCIRFGWHNIWDADFPSWFMGLLVGLCWRWHHDAECHTGSMMWL